MPGVYTKPYPMVDPYWGKGPGIGEGIGKILRTMSEIRAQRRKRQANDDVLMAASQAGTPEERLARVTETIRSSGTPEQKDQMARITLETLYNQTDPYRQAQLENIRARTQSAEALTEQRRTQPSRVYDVKSLNDALYEYTHDRHTGETVELSNTDLFTLNEMTKGSGYKVRKITTQEAKKIPFWPDRKEISEWVLESENGEIVQPLTQKDKKIKVISPDGVKGYVPLAQLEDALKEGYTRIE
jgi:hypothetical protein